MAGFIFPLFLHAQDTPLSSIYDSYVSKSGYSAQEIIPSKTSTPWEQDMDVSSIRQVIDQISSIRILSTEGKDGGSMKSLWKRITKAVSDADYTRLMEVSGDKMSVNFYGLKNANGNMKEFALTLKQDDQVMLVTLTGDIDMSSIFSKDVMQDLKKIGMEHKGECKKEL